ncbi:unnamed protein product [Hymenolepis diminuta]|uniref:Uncharacterized protein n=1 Tax=Hymenolepis diminuta TaxID=6216 RepID=A0A564YB86_HYMDI|nr:unnamed protein product [Hymenolepis diminuta]
MSPSFILFHIVPFPGGYWRFYKPKKYPQKPLLWKVKIGDKQVVNTFFPIKASTLLQAFLICLFLISKHFNIEMPLDVIQFDRSFYNELVKRFPGDSVNSEFY